MYTGKHSKCDELHYRGEYNLAPLLLVVYGYEVLRSACMSRPNCTKFSMFIVVLARPPLTTIQCTVAYFRICRRRHVFT